MGGDTVHLSDPMPALSSTSSPPWASPPKYRLNILLPSYSASSCLAHIKLLLPTSSCPQSPTKILPPSPIEEQYNQYSPSPMPPLLTSPLDLHSTPQDRPKRIYFPPPPPDQFPTLLYRSQFSQTSSQADKTPVAKVLFPQLMYTISPSFVIAVNISCPPALTAALGHLPSGKRHQPPTPQETDALERWSGLDTVQVGRGGAYSHTV